MFRGSSALRGHYFPDWFILHFDMQFGVQGFLLFADWHRVVHLSGHDCFCCFCANAGTGADIAMNPNASRIGSNLTLYPPVGWPDKPIAQPPAEERSTGVAVSPKPSDIFLIDQATAATLRFLRQPRSPNAPRPEAKSGSATRFI